MALLDWSKCPSVESIPGKVSGAWVFKGTRLPAATVIENLEDLSIDEVIEQFDVTRGRSRQCSISWRRASALSRSLSVLFLFDHGMPNGLIRALPGHAVHSAQATGWDTLSNGALLNAAEEAGVELLLTTDRRIHYQQNLRGRRIALVVLAGSTKWSCVRQHADRIAAAVASAKPGSYAEVEIRFEPKPGGH
jgi:uncharacterized protein (DUF433 family)